MPRRPIRRPRAWAEPPTVPRAVAALLAAVLVTGAGACGDGDSPVTPATGGSASAAVGGSAGPSAGATALDPVAEARAAVAVAYQGTYRSPDQTPRPAAKGRKIAIISSGQKSPTNAMPVAGAKEAAEALGWTVRLYDLELNPANAPKAVRQAVNDGADAIIANFDCILARNEFAYARAEGVELSALYGFDCDDKSLGPHASASLFTSFINYGLSRVDAPVYTAAFGAMNANLLIAGTNGAAKVIEFTDPSVSIMRYIHLGFLQQMGRCTTCTVLETVEFSQQDLTTGGLEAKAAAALARHPQANAIRTPFSAALHLGIAPALTKTGRHRTTMVVGGEGFSQDLDLIRTRQGLNATVIIDSTWTGWATVDALNSHFAGEEARPAGFGALLVDREHNLPPSGAVRHSVDYKSVYRRAWGVG